MSCIQSDCEELLRTPPQTLWCSTKSVFAVYLDSCCSGASWLFERVLVKFTRPVHSSAEESFFNIVFHSFDHKIVCIYVYDELQECINWSLTNNFLLLAFLLCAWLENFTFTSYIAFQNAFYFLEGMIHKFYLCEVWLEAHTYCTSLDMSDPIDNAAFVGRLFLSPK